jgi:CYTH domain-containing protein
MPIENERKYILRNPEDVENVLQKSDCYLRVIRQGYLPGDARIRASRPEKFVNSYLREQFYFTYKFMAETDLIEIETTIDQHDFDRLWPHTKKRLTKNRYVLQVDSCQWDIDIFYDDGERYFAMAECEMPESMDAPPEIPSIIAGFVVFEVPRDESRLYTNTEISNRHYAESIMAGFIA